MEIQPKEMQILLKKLSRDKSIMLAGMENENFCIN